jgi:hypothetical protein
MQDKLGCCRLLPMTDEPMKEKRADGGRQTESRNECRKPIRPRLSFRNKKDLVVDRHHEDCSATAFSPWTAQAGAFRRIAMCKDLLSSGYHHGQISDDQGS